MNKLLINKCKNLERTNMKRKWWTSLRLAKISLGLGNSAQKTNKLLIHKSENMEWTNLKIWSGQIWKYGVDKSENMEWTNLKIWSGQIWSGQIWKYGVDKSENMEWTNLKRKRCTSYNDCKENHVKLGTNEYNYDSKDYHAIPDHCVNEKQRQAYDTWPMSDRSSKIIICMGRTLKGGVRGR